MLLMAPRASTSSFAPSLASLSMASLSMVPSSTSPIEERALPPTCNLLDAAQRTRLIKSTRKLEKVLGTTPYVLEELEMAPGTNEASSVGPDRQKDRSKRSSRFTPPAPIVTSLSAIELGLSAHSDIALSSDRSRIPERTVMRTRSLSRASIATFRSLSSLSSTASSSTETPAEVESHNPLFHRRSSLDSAMSSSASTHPLVAAPAPSSSIANAFFSPLNAFIHTPVTIPGSDRLDSPHPPLLRLPQVSRLSFNPLRAHKRSPLRNSSDANPGQYDSTEATRPVIDRDALSSALSGAVASPVKRDSGEEDEFDDSNPEFMYPARSLDDLDVNPFPSRAKSRLGTYSYSHAGHEDSDCEEIDAELDSITDLYSPKSLSFDLHPPNQSSAFHDYSRRARARKLEKLSRHLGENVPSELVFGTRNAPKDSLKRSGTGRSVSSVATFSTSGHHGSTTSAFASSSESTTGPTRPQARRTSVSIGICGPPPNSDPLSAYGSTTTAAIYGKKTGAIRMRSTGSKSASPKVVAKDVGEWDAEEYQDVVKRLRALK